MYILLSFTANRNYSTTNYRNNYNYIPFTIYIVQWPQQKDFKSNTLATVCSFWGHIFGSNRYGTADARRLFFFVGRRWSASRHIQNIFAGLWIIRDLMPRKRRPFFHFSRRFLLFPFTNSLSAFLARGPRNRFSQDSVIIAAIRVLIPACFPDINRPAFRYGDDAHLAFILPRERLWNVKNNFHLKATNI